MNKIRQWFGIYDLIILSSAVLLWVFGEGWGKSAEHFGSGLWPLLIVAGVLIVSPVYALVSFFLTVRRFYREEVISTVFLWLRFFWISAILVHFVVLVWAPGNLG